MGLATGFEQMGDISAFCCTAYMYRVNTADQHFEWVKSENAEEKIIMCLTTWKRPGNDHQQISKVVWMSTDAPPKRTQQRSTSA